jgi:hypothetical protein
MKLEISYFFTERRSVNYCPPPPPPWLSFLLSSFSFFCYSIITYNREHMQSAFVNFKAKLNTLSVKHHGNASWRHKRSLIILLSLQNIHTVIHKDRRTTVENHQSDFNAFKCCSLIQCVLLWIRRCVRYVLEDLHRQQLALNTAASASGNCSAYFI